MHPLMQFSFFFNRIKIEIGWEFPGGLVVRIPDFHCRGLAQGTEIPHATLCGKIK